MSDDPTRTRADLINRMGTLIRAVRDSGYLSGDDFVAWRLAIYAIHGSSQEETDTVRADMIRATAREAGVL